MLTVEEFLESEGIKLETTALLSVIDGYMRQPDLCYLMNKYAELKLAEKNSIENKNKSI